MQPFHWLLAHNHVITKHNLPVFIFSQMFSFSFYFSSMIVSVIVLIESERRIISENHDSNHPFFDMPKILF